MARAAFGHADTEGDLIGCLRARHQITQPRGSGSRTCNSNGNTLDVNQHLWHNYRQVGCDESVCRLGVLALVDTGEASTTYTNSPFDHTALPDLMIATRSQFTRRDDSTGPHSYRAQRRLWQRRMVGAEAGQAGDGEASVGTSMTRPTVRSSLWLSLLAARSIWGLTL